MSSYRFWIKVIKQVSLDTEFPSSQINELFFILELKQVDDKFDRLYGNLLWTNPH
jgi:hypothetical protein